MKNGRLFSKSNQSKVSVPILNISIQHGAEMSYLQWLHPKKKQKEFQSESTK
jgi:hypothetical protein